MVSNNEVLLIDICYVLIVSWILGCLTEWGNKWKYNNLHHKWKKDGLDCVCKTLCAFDVAWIWVFHIANAKWVPCHVVGDIGNQHGERVDDEAT